MSPSFMLDSSACIHVLRGLVPFDALPARNDTAISSIVAAELWTGVEKSRGLDRGGSLEDFLRLFSIADFGSDDARRYAEIRADLERKRTLIGPMDLLIAAHALRLGASLITRNAREFKRVKGLKVQAWK